MRRTIPALVLALFVFLAFASGARAHEPLSLKFKWTKGQTYRYRMTMEQTSKTTMNKQVMSLNQSQIMTLRMTTVEITPQGEATVEAVMESVVADSSGPMGKTHYDSTKPDESDDTAIGKTFGTMVGEPLSVTFDAQGKVLKITGFDRILKKMLGDAGPGDDPTAKALRTSFTDETLKQMFEPTFRILPDHPVETGDSWPLSFSVQVPVLGAMKTDTTYTLTGVEDGAATLKVEGTMALAPGGDGEAANPLKDKFKFDSMEGKVSGQTRFDLGRGQIAKSESTTTTTSKMTMDPGGGLAPMSMAQDTQAKLRFELLPEGAESAPKPAAGSQGQPAAPANPKTDK